MRVKNSKKITRKTTGPKMPPPGLQIYLRLVWPWSLTSCDLDLDLDLKVDRFTPLARETLVPIGFKIGSKYCVNKFGNRRVDGQTNGQMEEQTDNLRRLCHRLPIRPWAGIRSRTHSVISLFVSVFRWDFQWVLIWTETKDQPESEVVFFRLDSAIRWAFRWDQTSDWAIAEIQS